MLSPASYMRPPARIRLAPGAECCQARLTARRFLRDQASRRSRPSDNTGCSSQTCRAPTDLASQIRRYERGPSRVVPLPLPQPAPTSPWANFARRAFKLRSDPRHGLRATSAGGDALRIVARAPVDSTPSARAFLPDQRRRLTPAASFSRWYCRTTPFHAHCAARSGRSVDRSRSTYATVPCLSVREPSGAAVVVFGVRAGRNRRQAGDTRSRGRSTGGSCRPRARCLLPEIVPVCLAASGVSTRGRSGCMRAFVFASDTVDP